MRLIEGEIKKECCCGCSACMAICPKSAISMKEDVQGFLYPVVDNNKCIDCGLCVIVCRDKKIVPHQVCAYAAKSMNTNIQLLSSSGGVSFELAKKTIEDGGVAYGVVYDKKHRVCYDRAKSEHEAERFFGSKYVQSDPLDTYREIKKDLMDGLKVMCFGTSCYVAGLKSYLLHSKCNDDNLITCDLICHGVPSPKVFEDYICFLKRDPLFDHFEFRTKKLPWGYGSKNYGCTIFRKDGSQQTDTVKARIFLRLFFSNNCIRPYCHNCPFVGINKPADITIADYWGIQQEHPSFFDEKGVSAVITHNTKGDEYFKTCRIEWINSTIEKIANKQSNMEHPSPRGADYFDFWQLYNSAGFRAVAKKYGGYTLKEFIKQSFLFDIIRTLRNQ